MSSHKCWKTSFRYISRSAFDSRARNRSSVGLACFKLMQSFLFTSPFQLADLLFLCSVVPRSFLFNEIFRLGIKLNPNWPLVLKYFLKLASHDLSAKTLLSEHAIVQPYSPTAVHADFSLPLASIKSSLVKRATQMKHFVTTQSKDAPCIFLFFIYLVACLSSYHEKAINALYELA